MLGVWDVGMGLSGGVNGGGICQRKRGPRANGEWQSSRAGVTVATAILVVVGFGGRSSQVVGPDVVEMEEAKEWHGRGTSWVK